MRVLIKRSIEKLSAYKVKKEDLKIKLNANESPYDMPIELKKLIADALLNESLNRYPDSESHELKKRILNYTGLDNENIILGNGSDEIIKMIIDAFLDKDDIVVTHSPTFSMYRINSNIAGGKVIEIENDLFEIDIDKLIDIANENKAKIIFLCTPNNPTGTLIPSEDIIKVLKNTNSLVVVDEAYYEFCGQTMIDKVNEYKNLIVLRTLSKAFGLAGIRVGYGAANKEIIDILNKVKPPYNLNKLSQLVGTIALDNKDIFSKCIEKIIRERKRLVNELSSMVYIEVIPSYGNFILIRSDKYSEILKGLENKGIGVKGYGEVGILKNCIRISIGTKEENEMVLNVLKEV